jgi:hypothetical protein
MKYKITSAVPLTDGGSQVLEDEVEGGRIEHFEAGTSSFLVFSEGFADSPALLWLRAEHVVRIEKID